VADPNPLWIRELRQSVRLGRTPFLLLAITLLMTFVIASIGGGMSDSSPASAVGSTIFHAFFSLAFFLVVWAGPALAANSVAIEREGRTWEAILLTGMQPQSIARGKFLAAYSELAAYIVMLAPVGALCFMFGGVHPIEVAIAFAYLFVFALLSVAFGLAISAQMSTSRGAILLTLLLTIPSSFFVFGFGGVALSQGAHTLWTAVPGGPPVWLPLAYVRGTFGPEYVALLLGLPALGICLPAWFLYEATIASISGANDDTSSGLKRWYIAATLALTTVGLVTLYAVPDGAVSGTAATCVCLASLHGMFCALLFASEPPRPSRRVLLAWDRAGVGTLRRHLGPGLVGTSLLELALGTSSVVALAAIGAARLRASAMPGSPLGEVVALLRFGAFSASFLVFLIGLVAALRTRVTTVVAARVVSASIVFGLAVVPWVVAAVGGLSSGSKEALALAAPSPFFAFTLLDSTPDASVTLAGLVAGATYLATGLALTKVAARRTAEIVDAHDRRVAETEQLLAAEEAALTAAETNATLAAPAAVDDSGAATTAPTPSA
jgi:ABC-type transport system involved in multi-copper enzyme maturation permease subunit